MRTPLLLVTGVHPTAIDTAMMGLGWDLPQAVTVRHRIDPESQVLTRIVSDATGVIEHEQVLLEHMCVSCALREDILPTLERLARDGRWSAIVAGLPTGAEAPGVAIPLTRDPRLAKRLRLAGVVCAVEGVTGEQTLDAQILGDDLLSEHGWHTTPEDERCLGEVVSAQIEYADLVLAAGETPRVALDLVRALARPGVEVVTGTHELDALALLGGRHSHRDAMAWVDVADLRSLPPLPCDSLAWRIELSADRAFHPERLLDRIEALGAGAHRSRGCFWVPTRPGMCLDWAGAGGQLSIGAAEPWARRSPHTRIVLTGVGTVPAGLAEAFEDLLVTPEEARLAQRSWDVLEDGLEPWLGDIRDIA